MTATDTPATPRWPIPPAPPVHEPALLTRGVLAQPATRCVPEQEPTNSEVFFTQRYTALTDGT